MRFRKLFTIIAMLMVVTLWIVTDPALGLMGKLPVGAGLLATIVILSKGVIGPSFLHFVRKWMFDYDVADFEKLGLKAIESPVGAALFALAISVMCLSFTGMVAIFVYS